MSYFIRVFCFTASIMSLCCSLTIFASEGGSTRYPLGYGAATSAGISPPPGTIYVRNDVFHRAAHIKGVVNVKTSLDILQLRYITHLKFIGADYGYGAVFNAGRNHVSRTTTVNVSTLQIQPNGQPAIVLVPKKKKVHGSAHGMGDISVQPIRLGWHWPEQNMHVQFVQTVFLPTAKWKRSRVANMGRPFYSTDSSVGITWKDDKIGSEISVYTGVIINFMNHKTHYRSGTGWHNEFYVGQRVIGDLTVGWVAYWFEQLTPDSGKTVPCKGYRGKLFGNGPYLGYKFTLAKIPCSANIRYFHDTYQKNNQKGNSFFFTLTANF